MDKRNRGVPFDLLATAKGNLNGTQTGIRPGLAVLLMAIIIFGHGQARADMVYSSLPDYSQPAFQSNSTGGVAFQFEQESSPFMVTSTTSITRASWWGDYDDGELAPDNFTLALYSGVAGPDPTAIAMSSTLDVTRTDTGFMNSNPSEVYFYSATLSTPFQLTAGTQYYLAILDEPLSWDWQFGEPGTNYYRNGVDGTPWNDSLYYPVQDAFQLFGPSAVATPEPSSIILICSAMPVGLAWMRRRRKA